MKTNSQEKRILNYFKSRKTLDRFRAFTDLGIFELAARIAGLEKKGHKFEKKRLKGKNRWNEPFNYTQYKLLA